MPDQSRRADVYAGLILCGLCGLVLVESWRMPRDLQGWPAYASPGVVTGSLALGLLAMGVALVIRAVRRAGARVTISGDEVRRFLAGPGTRRLALMGLLGAAYLLSLGQGLPYHLTIGGFLAVTMLLFGARPWWAVLLISGVTTAAMALVFNRIFLIPLP
ncbi:MAG: tripartite tricarboxylate transporter TctB family protein [Candidatus Rokuibacteriota bacterium]